MKNQPSDDIKPVSRRDEERLLEAGRTVFSTAFPNPNREGCPSQETIQAIAFRRVELSKHRDFMVHMSRCSPCFNDYGRFLEAAKRQKRLRVLGTAAAVIIVALLGAWLWSGLKRLKGPGPVESASLDLTKRPIFRGSERLPSAPPLQLAKGRLALTIYLSVGAEPGTYEVQVLKEIGQPIWSGQGEANLENHTTTLHLSADLQNCKPGPYLLGVRPRGWEWTYYQLTVK